MSLNKIYNSFTAIGFMTCWLVVITQWYDVVYGGIASRFYPQSEITTVWIALIMAPVFEELFFRKLWIDFIDKFAPYALIPAICASSLLFAWFHNYQYWGILVQGVLGLTSSWLYLKNDKCYISCILFHAGYNYMCLYGFKILA